MSIPLVSFFTQGKVKNFPMPHVCALWESYELSMLGKKFTIKCQSENVNIPCVFFTQAKIMFFPMPFVCAIWESFEFSLLEIFFRTNIKRQNVNASGVFLTQGKVKFFPCAILCAFYVYQCPLSLHAIRKIYPNYKYIYISKVQQVTTTSDVHKLKSLHNMKMLDC